MLITKEDCGYEDYSEKITLIKDCRKINSCISCRFSSDFDGFKGCPSFNLFDHLSTMLGNIEDGEFSFYSKEVLYEEIDF